jgi:hypothetical protein
MPRPPSERIDEAFEIWSTEDERNDTRTAELMGLPQSTVSYWHRTYGWDQRYLAFIQPDGDVFAGVARAEIRSALPAIVIRLRHIVEARKPVYNEAGEPIGEVYASQDRDAIQAAKLLSQYGFEGGAGQDSTIFDAHAVVLPEARTTDGEQSVADLKRQVSAMIEATVQSVNTRPSRSHKRV